MMVITSDTYPARNSKAQKKIYIKIDQNKLVVWYSGGNKDLNNFSYDPVSRDLVLNCSDDSRNGS